MRIEITGMDRRTFNRVRYKLDEAGIAYWDYQATGTLVTESDDPAELRSFVNVALHGRDTKVMR